MWLNPVFHHGPRLFIEPACERSTSTPPLRNSLSRLWASPGRNEETLHSFFDALGPVRCKQLQLVSADAASYIANVVKERCPNVALCLDPFHIVKWATEALDEVRREVWHQLRRAGKKGLS